MGGKNGTPTSPKVEARDLGTVRFKLRSTLVIMCIKVHTSRVCMQQRLPICSVCSKDYLSVPICSVCSKDCI